MAPTYSNGQEMVSIYLIKIKITTKFFKFPLQNLSLKPINKILFDTIIIFGKYICLFINLQKKKTFSFEESKIII